MVRTMHWHASANQIQADHMAEAHSEVDVLGSTGGVNDVDAAGPSTYSPSSPFAAMCEIATAVAVVAMVAAVATGHYFIGLLVSAVLCGIAEAQGRCGTSHICTIAPLRRPEPRTWLKCVSAYSIGGLATSYVVGLALAGSGTLAASAVQPSHLFVLAGVVGFAFLLRELRVLRFSPPQCDVQTHKRWMYEFGFVTAAGMWGSHIGLAVTTVVTHGGLYPLVLAAFASGLGSGEWVLVAFWVGRILPTWLAPTLCGRSSNAVVIYKELRRAVPSFDMIAISGIAALSGLCLAMALV